MKNVKLIVSDVDGTLVSSSDASFSTNLINTLKELDKQNKYFVLCSGRPTFSLISLAKEINQNAEANIIKFVSGYNGGEIYDVVNDKYLLQDGIDADEVNRINNFIISLNQDILNYDGDVVVSNNPNNVHAQHEAIICKKPVEQLTNTKFSPKVLGLVNPKDMDDVLNQVQKELVDYKVTRSTPYFLEINNKHIDKSNTLKFLMDYLNINHEDTMGMGDNLNDYELIEYAKYGVSLENGLDEVKNIANIVIGDVKDDAVSIFINEKVL